MTTGSRVDVTRSIPSREEYVGIPTRDPLLLGGWYGYGTFFEESRTRVIPVLTLEVLGLLPIISQAARSVER